MKHMIKIIGVGIIIAGFNFGGIVSAVTLQMVANSSKIKPGQSMTVDIVADNPAELSGVILTMTYPSDALSLDIVPVTTNYFPAENWQAVTSLPGKVALTGLKMETGDSNTKLFSVHFSANMNVASGLYNLALQQTLLCNGPAGWGTDHNNNGAYDAGDEYVPAPILYSVDYQPGTQDIVTSILLESFTINPQIAFRMQGGKTKTAVASATTDGGVEMEIQPNVVVLKQPPENEFGVSVNPLLEVDLLPEVTISDISQMLWQIGKDQNFTELVFATARQLEITDVQVPVLVLDPQSTYYWRVNGVDADGQTENGSTAAVFTTGTEDAIDLNGNGIPDHQDVDTYENQILISFPEINVVGLKVLKNASGEKQFAIEPGDGTLLVDRARWENPDETLIQDKESIAYPSGLLAFRLYTTLPGETAPVTVYYSTPMTSGSKWRNYSPQLGWFFASSSNAVISKDRKTVVLNLTDGGDGDADGVANGVIVCFGGPSMRSK